MQKADAETQALLTDFDLSGEGYTLILPVNEARDYNATGQQAKAPVFEVYDFDPNTTTTAEVTEVCIHCTPPPPPNSNPASIAVRTLRGPATRLPAMGPILCAVICLHARMQALMRVSAMVTGCTVT